MRLLARGLGWLLTYAAIANWQRDWRPSHVLAVLNGGRR